MLKFFAILGTILAALVAIFMVVVNLELLEPQDKADTNSTVVEQVIADETGVSDDEEVTEPVESIVVSENGYVNGIYTATEPMFDVTSGWKKVVKVEIRNGKIYDVIWDEVYKDGGKTKKELSESGEYMMTEDSLPWHKQSFEAEDFVIDIENPENVENIDAISSVTIDSSSFLELVKLCLAEAKVKE